MKMEAIVEEQSLPSVNSLEDPKLIEEDGRILGASDPLDGLSWLLMS